MKYSISDLDIVLAYLKKYGYLEFDDEESLNNARKAVLTERNKMITNLLKQLNT